MTSTDYEAGTRDAITTGSFAAKLTLADGARVSGMGRFCLTDLTSLSAEV